jgi:hypothetical protein
MLIVQFWQQGQWMDQLQFHMSCLWQSYSVVKTQSTCPQRPTDRTKRLVQPRKLLAKEVDEKLTDLL